MRRLLRHGRMGLLAAAALVVAVWFPMAPAHGQGPDAPAQETGTEAEPDTRQAIVRQPDPGVFEIVPRARILADSAARAERTISRLGNVAGLRAELDDAVQRRVELQALLGSMMEMDFVRLERLSRLRDQALLEDSRLEALNARLMDRLGQLGDLRARWAGHQQQWRDWRRRLQADPDYPDVAPDIDLAQSRIDTVVTRASRVAGELLALQRNAEELRSDMEQIGAVVAAIRTGRRRALVQRSEPALLSPAHRAQLALGEWREWRPIAAIEPRAYPAFVRDHLGLLTVHIFLAVLLGLAARRLRRVGAPDDGWGGLLDHPWALGVLASVAAAMQRVTLAPPLWDVVLWIAFGVAASLLSRRLFQPRALRWTVYLLAAFYPVFLLLEVVQLPVPVFRLGLAAVAAIALPTFLVLGRRRTAAAAAAGSTDPLRIWPLRIGAAMWAVVLLAVVAGWDALGRWILHSTVTTGALAFVVVLVFALARAALPLLLRSADTGRILRGVGVTLVQRIILLLQIVVATAAALVLLDIWGIAESPVATWQWIVGLGFEVGPVELTVGRFLVAALVFYLAVLLSGIVRTIVATDVERRQDGDRGLGESISRLVHYAVVTLGFILALAALGVELQNFAIIAGALGIGVGFGLQNVVNNFASGLILLFERPVRVGDTVVLDDVWGTIRKIGLRSTVMVTFDQSEMIVPNADLVSEKVTNWTLSNPTARIILPVGVAYGSPVAQVLEILTESAFVHETVLKEPPPEALFVAFGDSSLDFELRIWVDNIRKRLQVRSAVLAEVERRLGEAGIEVPFPQRDLHVRSVDADVLARWTDGG
jgi:potassium-dependent mechanosensitive channel